MDFRVWLEDRQRFFDFMRVPKVTPDDVKKLGLFGPVYHGTSQENHQNIADTGFRYEVGHARQGQTTHGYEGDMEYSAGLPAPIHHLGYGVYFTTVKNIAKTYNLGTTKGLKQYYLHVPRLETINFGSPNTMMRWWIQNGYNMQPSSPRDTSYQQKRLEATFNMTNVLKSKYDAVWFKGKGLRTLLDGDQVVVFDPHNIYELTMDGYIVGDLPHPGDRFVVKDTSATAVAVDVRSKPKKYEGPWDKLLGFSPYHLHIKNLKNFEQIQRFRVPLTNIIEKYFIDFMKERQKNSGLSAEDNLNHYLDYLLDFSKNRYNFPSALVGRVLNKGERLK